MARMESGVVQFGEEDWPGLFLRGDDALAVGVALGGLLEDIAKAQKEGTASLPSVIQLAVIKGLAEDLLSVDVRRTDRKVTMLKPADDCRTQSSG